MTHSRCRTVIFFLLMSAVSALPADSPAVVFFLSPFFGVEHGQIQEHVFCDTGAADLYQLSRLDWDMSAFAKAGVTVDAFFRPVRAGLFSVSLNAETGFPGKTGIMQDYDWQEMDGILTDYSTHTNSLLAYYRAGAEFSWCIPGTAGNDPLNPAAADTSVDASLPEQSTVPAAREISGAVAPQPDLSGLSISAGAEYIYYSFSGTDGYAQHASYDNPDVFKYWSAEIEKGYFSGAVIDYALYGLQVWAGLSYNLRFTSVFSAALSVRFYPLMILSGDDHHYNKAYYFDTLSGYGGWSGALETLFRITAKDSLGILIQGEYYPVITGDTYSRNEYSSTYVQDFGYQGGSSRWNIGMNVFFRRML